MAEAPRYDDSLPIALLRARDAVTAQFRDHVMKDGAATMARSPALPVAPSLIQRPWQAAV